MALSELWSALKLNKCCCELDSGAPSPVNSMADVRILWLACKGREPLGGQDKSTVVFKDLCDR